MFNKNSKVISIGILGFITIASVFSFSESQAQPTNCEYWGEIATVVAINYDAVMKMGSSPAEAMAETKELFDYDNHIKKGGMGGAYYGAVFKAIENGARGGVLHKVGATVCLSFPAGTFDPDRFGKYD